LTYTALRLYPLFPLLGRECLKDTELPVGGGSGQGAPIFVAKGTPLFTSFWSLHRDESVFGPDVDQFVPARWEKIRPKQWEYVPFGAGQRSCLGKGKVLAEAAFVVARLTKTFSRAESRDAKPWKELVMLTAKNINGCKIALYY
jgi:cytochrome P450